MRDLRLTPPVVRILAFSGLVLGLALSPSAAPSPRPAAGPAAVAASIPYPKALADAAIKQKRLDDITQNALVVGNGDLNALLYGDETGLRIRIGKSDVWDARIDTSADPDPAKIDLRGHSWAGGVEDTPSWQAHAYPRPVICAAATLVTRPPIPHKKYSWKSRLDLDRAVATIGKPRAEVRVLADRNVILVRGSWSAQALVEQPMKSDAHRRDDKGRWEDDPAAADKESIPPAESGTTEGIRWIRQRLPGDADYPGMDYAVAMGGQAPTIAIAVVTSHEEKDVTAAAVRRVSETLAADPEALVREHDAAWTAFWSRSGVQLGDRDFQNWWYRSLYFMRCFCKPGATAVGLQAGLPAAEAADHGAYRLTYNAQQTFWAQLVTNHVDETDPYVDLLRNQLPRARHFARLTYGLTGAFFNGDLFPFEPADAPNSRNFRLIARMPSSYTLGLTAWAAWQAWLRHVYDPDPAALKERIYPILRDAAEFYVRAGEALRTEEDGTVLLGPSYNPEHGGFGTDNNPLDIAFVSNLLEAFTQASAIVGGDAELAGRCGELLKRMPTYPTAESPAGPVIVDWKGCGLYDVPVHGITSPAFPVFPAERVTWFSPDAEKAMFRRTIDGLRHNGEHAEIMFNVAKARLSMAEAPGETREWFHAMEQPNGLLYMVGRGYDLSESWAVSGLISEFLCQSAGDVVRLFPCWVEGLPASFSGLRARGGFLVSAARTASNVTSVSVTSTAGGTLRLMAPWASTGVRRGETVERLTPDARHIVEVPTKPGETLQFVEMAPASAR